MPNPVLMEDIVTGVLTELRLVSGVDVQIHLQDGIVAAVNRLYRYLMSKYVFRDFVYMQSLTCDPNGEFPIDVAKLDSFKDLLAVYLENTSDPLPVAPTLSNIAQFRRPVVVPSGNANVFRIYPQQDQRNAIIWSRRYDQVDVGIDGEIPFYKDVLVLGAAWNLSTKMGVNDQLTGNLQSEYMEQVRCLIMDELQDNYQTNVHRGSYPTEWYVAP